MSPVPQADNTLNHGCIARAVSPRVSHRSGRRDRIEREMVITPPTAPRWCLVRSNDGVDTNRLHLPIDQLYNEGVAGMRQPAICAERSALLRQRRLDMQPRVMRLLMRSTRRALVHRLTHECPSATFID